MPNGLVLLQTRAQFEVLFLSNWLRCYNFASALKFGINMLSASALPNGSLNTSVFVVTHKQSLQSESNVEQAA